MAILVAGVLLRVVYAWGADVRNVHDDHFHVIRIMLEEHHWPKPDEDWQTYQPPLYHLLGAVIYCSVAGGTTDPLDANPRHATARKAIQFLSVASGIGTLILVWLSLRWVFPGAVFAQAAGMTLAAFLPRHTYMSAMATNDALIYLWASLCVYAVLRALSPPVPGGSPTSDAHHRGWWVTAGVAAALAMWTKSNGLGSLAALGVLIPLSWMLKDPVARRGQLHGSLLAVGIALALGVWPYVRTYHLTGDPLAGNYALRPNTMGDQRPGTLADVSFCSLRIGRLLRRPWRHLDTIDSFGTNLYARLWFDYDTSMTLFQYRPWWEYMLPIWRDRSVDGRERERRQLIWNTDIAHPTMLWQGRFLVVLGLIPAALIVIGMVSACRRHGARVANLFLLACLGMGVAAPLFQTLRQPFRSSMKAAFILPALIALVVFFVTGCQSATEHRYLRWLRWLVVANLVLLAAVAVWHFIELGLLFPHSLDYFPRRDPL